MGTKHYMPTFKHFHFVPTDIGGCVLWLKSDTGITKDERITNGTFETGDTTGWAGINSPPTFEVQSVTKYSGQYALKVGNVYGKGANQSGLSFIQNAYYKLSVRVFVGTDTIPFGISWWLNNGAGNLIAEGTKNTQGEWIEITHTWQESAGGGSGAFGIILEEWDGTCYFYLDNVSIVQTDSNYNPLVLQWDDQSGNGNNMAQSIVIRRPSLTANQLNGYSSMRFDGSNDYMKTDAAFGQSQPATIFSVVKMITWVYQGWIYVGLYESEDYAFVLDMYPNSSPSLQMYSGLMGPAITSLAVGSWGILCAEWNGASSTLRLNAGSPATGNVGTRGFDNGFFIGGNGDARFSNIDLAEIIMYNSILSASNRQKVENYLNGRYAIY